MAKTKTPAEILRAWRGDRSQLDAARDLDVHPNFYSDYERGKRCNPSREFAIKMRDVCGVPVDAWGS